VARAIQDTVFVSWTDVGLHDVLFYNVYRSVGAGEFQLVWNAPYPTNTYVDTSVVFGTSYRYQISASGAKFESIRSEEVISEPGPNIVWVSDNLNGGVAKLTHDGRTALDFFSGFSSVAALVADKRRSVTWVVQNGFGLERAFRLSGDGRMLTPIIPLDDPADVALVERTGSIWIADGQGGRVLRVNSTGFGELNLTNFGEPVAVDVDQLTESCWIADNGLRSNGTRAVVGLTASGDIARVIELTGGELYDIEVDDRDGSIWVAQENTIVKLVRSGAGYSTARIGTFEVAWQIEIDQESNNFWVLDIEASTLRKYSLDGELLFEISGLDSPRGMAIGTFDHSCYVADTGNDRVIRVSPSGQILSVFSDIRLPVALSIEN
jgi:hypothetical protein